jgi:hypothetical protein
VKYLTHGLIVSCAVVLGLAILVFDLFVFFNTVATLIHLVYQFGRENSVAFYFHIFILHLFIYMFIKYEIFNFSFSPLINVVRFMLQRPNALVSFE